MHNTLSQLPDGDLHGRGYGGILYTVELCKDIFFQSSHARAFDNDTVPTNCLLILLFPQLESTFQML